MKRDHRQAGVTLLELTVAMALLAAILAGAAQALISYYEGMTMQKERVAATENCRAVLSAMRDTRDANQGSFPEAITSQFPDGGTVSGTTTLDNEQVTVDYIGTIGNPLEVRVTSQWPTLRNRPMSVSVSTVLTDR